MKRWLIAVAGLSLMANFALAQEGRFRFWYASVLNRVFVEIQGSPFNYPPYAEADFVQEFASLNGTDHWNIPTRGILASVQAVEGNDENSCSFYSRELQALMRGLIYQFRGQPHSITIRGVAAGNFFDDIFIDGRRCPPSFGVLTTFARVGDYRGTSVEFSLDSPAILTIFQTVGYTFVAQYFPDGIISGIADSGVSIYLVNGDLVYWRGVTLDYPGGIQTTLDEVYLPAGRYILHHTINASMSGSAWSDGNGNFVWQIRLSGGGGDSSMVRAFLGRLTPPSGIDIAQLIYADINGDGCVDDADLLEVISSFGTSPGAADVNNDGAIDDADLLVILSLFGLCYLQ